MMASQAQVIIHTPQSASWRAQANFDGGTHILRALPLKPGAAASNGTDCMSIAVANLWPAIHLAIHSHRDAIGVEATKTGIPGLNAIKPEVISSIDAIQNITLATVAEEAVEWMSYNRKSALLMYEINNTLHAQVWRDAFLDKESQQMPFGGSNLFPDDEVKAIRAFHPEITRAQSTLYHIVVGNGDHIQTGIILDMMQNLFNRANTITVRAMHVQVGFARLSCIESLPLGHLLVFS